MIRVGIIGCGSITRFRHAPEYMANPHCEIAGFYNPSIKKAEEMSRMFGGKVYSSYMDMLLDKKIDAVSVCTANKYHAPVTIDALKAGKHVLCEKPMAASLDEARNMVEASHKAGKYLMIAHNQRLEPANVKAKEILKGGELGRILSFRAAFGHGGPEFWSANKGKNTWFFKKDAAFAGVIGDLGIHKADLIRWLIDDEIEEVSAFLTTADKRDENGLPVEVDDNAICLLRSKSGIIGTLSASWTYYGEMDNSTVIYCEKGIMKIYNTPDHDITIVKSSGEQVHYRFEKNETKEGYVNSGVIDLFVESIVNNVPPMISGEEGLSALKIILACLESAKKGTVVKVI